MPDIKIKNLKINYKHKKETYLAIDGLDAFFKANSFSVIVGPSGCGKTSLLKAIIGLIPYDGDIYFDDIDSIEMEINDKNIAYVSQNFALYPHLTIFDNIAFPLKMINAPKEEIIQRVNEIASQLGLTACLSRKPKHISGGQQQRVALARALIKKPDICLFDEPLSNLDEKNRFEAIYLLKKSLSSLNTTVLYVTHDFMEAMAFADTIYVIDNKKIVLSGTPKELYNSDNEIIKYMIKAGEIKNDI